MTTAMPVLVLGDMAFRRPEGRIGVDEDSRLTCVGRDGLAGLAAVSLEGFLGMPLSGRGCLSLAPGGRTIRLGWSLAEDTPADSARGGAVPDDGVTAGSNELFRSVVGSAYGLE